MAFNVGSGVLQRMQELGDSPTTDSKFLNSIDGKSRSEWGYGVKYDYRAVGTLQSSGWQWEVNVYKLPLEQVNVKFIDMRGKLPKRGTYPLRPIAAIDTLCVHYTAAPPERTVQDIATYQTTVQTGDLFPEIAYHLFVENNGMLVWCHNADKRVWGSGQQGMNERAIHICYSGNTAPNEAQIEALVRGKQFATYSMLEPTRQLTVVGHKDGYATQCPGATWDTWKARII